MEGLRGVTLSLIDADDFSGQCSGETYPLLRSVANVFGFKGTTSSTTRFINPPGRSEIFCSISSHAESFDSPMSFSLDKLNSSLCMYLLIDYQSQFLTRSNLEQLKMTNRKLKIFMTIPSSIGTNEIRTLNRIYQMNNLDGINIRLSLTPSEKNLTKFIQVKRENRSL